MLYIFTLAGLLVAAFAEILYFGQIGGFIYSAFPVLFSLLFVLSYNGQNSLRLIGSSFFIALILCIPLIGIDTWTSRQRDFIIIYTLLVYLVHCFQYTYHRHGNLWNMNYATMFEAAWTTPIILLFGYIFDFALNALILFAAILFSKLGSPYLYNLHQGHVYLTAGFGILFIFIGMGIAQKHIKSVNGLRFALVSCMYYCLPILAISSLVYFVLFLLWVWKNALDNPIININNLFELIIASIVFLNAYYQDGNDEKNRLVWLDVFLRFYKVLLLVMILTISYFAFSYMSLDINHLIVLIITLFLGWVYALSAFLADARAQQEMEYANKGLAMVFIVALYFANLPYLSINYTMNKERPSISLWSFTDFTQKSTTVREN